MLDENEKPEKRTFCFTKLEPDAWEYINNQLAGEKSIFIGTHLDEAVRHSIKRCLPGDLKVLKADIEHCLRLLDKALADPEVQQRTDIDIMV